MFNNGGKFCPYPDSEVSNIVFTDGDRTDLQVLLPRRQRVASLCTPLEHLAHSSRDESRVAVTNHRERWSKWLVYTTNLTTSTWTQTKKLHKTAREHELSDKKIPRDQKLDSRGSWLLTRSGSRASPQLRSSTKFRSQSEGRRRLRWSCAPDRDWRPPAGSSCLSTAWMSGRSHWLSQGTNTLVLSGCPLSSYNKPSWIGGVMNEWMEGWYK